MATASRVATHHGGAEPPPPPPPPPLLRRASSALPLPTSLSHGEWLQLSRSTNPQHTHFAIAELANPFVRCDGASQADVDVETEVAAAGQPKKRTFRKYSYRGVDLDALLDMSTDDLVQLFPARARRRFQRGLKRKPMALVKRLRKAKKEAPAGEKPEPVRTHLRNMIIVPEMIGSIIGVYNGKTFNQVEIRPEMIGHYLAEFSISYKPVKHGRPGIGATHSSSEGAMATISAAGSVTLFSVARPSQAHGLTQLRARAGKVRCGACSKQQDGSGKAPAAPAGASLLAAASAMTTSPALALVDERMSTEGTGLSLGLSNNLLGWLLLGVFGLIWSLYTVYTSTLEEDEESGGLSL
ncbi:40S ribosomal protein S15 [Dichanthelium oligosanthes]|nr:40S ribosomal protein S15 [Dichanthelium oligosanthes]